jgi:hypothetical protein
LAWDTEIAWFAVVSSATAGAVASFRGAEKADKATAREDQVKFQWLDAHLRNRQFHTITRDEIQAIGKATAAETSPRYRQSLSRTPAGRIEAGSRSVTMDRESAGHYPLSKGKTVGAVAYER